MEGLVSADVDRDAEQYYTPLLNSIIHSCWTVSYTVVEQYYTQLLNSIIHSCWTLLYTVVEQYYLYTVVNQYYTQ